MIKESKFAVADYGVLVGSLLISVLTGIYFAIKDRNQGTDVYFFGKGKMSPWPVGLSLAVSFVSAVTVVGYPVEIYLYGTVWFWVILCFPVVVALTSSYFIPLYHRLKLKCVYEYLELRFNKAARLICSGCVMAYMFVYMAVVIYIPALMLTALIPISVYWTIILTSVICTFYTVIGGLKSVMWTDAFQCVIMVLGALAILIRSTILVGGVSEVFEAVERGGRNTQWNFSTDMTLRCTAWSCFIGMFWDWFVLMTSNQTNAQRYLSCKTVTTAKWSLIICMIPQMVITFIALATGMALYAYYEGCDPVTIGELDENNQLMSLLVAKITQGLPGMNGLFVATVFSATLSTVSSGINSLTVMVMEDFVALKWKKIQEDLKLRISKFIGLALGVLLLILTMAVTFVKGTILELCVSLLSTFSPPVMGMFALGMWFPWANSKGTLVGAFFGFLTGIWLFIGSQLYHFDGSELSTSIDQCSNSTLEALNFTLNTNYDYATTAATEELNTGFSMYNISFLYFRAISIIITIVFGLIASFATGKNDPRDLNPKLFVPLIESKIFPEKFVRFMRFGVPELTEKTNRDEELTSLHIKCED